MTIGVFSIYILYIRIYEGGYHQISNFPQKHTSRKYVLVQSEDLSKPENSTTVKNNSKNGDIMKVEIQTRLDTTAQNSTVNQVEIS